MHRILLEDWDATLTKAESYVSQFEDYDLDPLSGLFKSYVVRKKGAFVGTWITRASAIGRKSKFSIEKLGPIRRTKFRIYSMLTMEYFFQFVRTAPSNSRLVTRAFPLTICLDARAPRDRLNVSHRCGRTRCCNIGDLQLYSQQGMDGRLLLEQDDNHLPLEPSWLNTARTHCNIPTHCPHCLRFYLSNECFGHFLAGIFSSEFNGSVGFAFGISGGS
jgi:hypothetical protein